MQFDWSTLKPYRELTEEQKNLVQEIGNNFLAMGTGVPDHQKRVALGRKRGLLTELTQLGLIRYDWNRYYPAFPSFFYLPAALRDPYAETLDSIFKAIKELYSSNPQTFTIQQIEAQVKLTAPPTVQAYVQRAALFLLDFTYFCQPQQPASAGSAPVSGVTASDNILDYEDLQQAWSSELTAHPRPQLYPADRQTPPSSANLKTPPKPGSTKKYGGWEIMDKLGSGGQSDVFLAQSPTRVAQRQKCLEQIRTALDGHNSEALATSIWNYGRPDSDTELGALKVFKIREGGSPAQERLKREIFVLRENRRKLPKLLDANVDEQWMVTEYFPGGSLAKSPTKYKGKALLALRAFRTLVETVATSLHEDKIVHRDLKPANVFIASDGSLIPGDFGIVFLPAQEARPTVTDERVGPWEYMPQWADLGVRLEDVSPSFDVYMLGKLLWWMIAGRPRLPREYHRRPDFDLSVIFPEDDHMHLINRILDKCLVDRPEDCLASARELLTIVDETLAFIDQGVPLLDENGNLQLRCRACGKGSYQEEGTVSLNRLDPHGRIIGQVLSRVFTCNVCSHRQFFAPGYPDEAAERGWKPLTSLAPKN